MGLHAGRANEGETVQQATGFRLEGHHGDAAHHAGVPAQQLAQLFYALVLVAVADTVHVYVCMYMTDFRFY